MQNRNGFRRTIFCFNKLLYMEKNYTKKLSNSTRRFIRSEKARIRTQFLDFKKQEEMIAQMYSKLNKKETKSPSDAPELKNEKLEEKDKKPKKTIKKSAKNK
ncbi:MAG: hypothetical protein A3D34_02100 [Candidatus Staskawiczbacteria bacterium RIFCSPHIGHO2_02_FULL_33_16]|uniref:Uncharacterized protein n=1 Tax=Candidatus Staskawiczbacteria bacterium RIFCSPHIGHO2_02_FULL_33_16 TaxID=1802204 RepID=A0A1G2HWL5_9BACT|nr:MAG: hypothetical protein A3D34_02100 [Candidatus Staskawiczbacteria bacterium RIFCSPHIGHO2_02_FULL_33_16]OGZ70838.1 MAG: hypothetical protein A2980_02310 [Candidatus Staskawiczbacteria bacterium RIFCSPLOWO2_01_FULL_33_13]